MNPTRGLLAMTLLSSLAAAQDKAAIPELGSLRYSRDLDAAIEAKDGKPLFVVFQEVPG